VALTQIAADYGPEARLSQGEKCSWYSTPAWVAIAVPQTPFAGIVIHFFNAKYNTRATAASNSTFITMISGQ
jgi:hypothetical protein